MSAFLRAFGAFVPEHIVSNADLSARLGCTPDWIESVSGIRERRWAMRGETVADLAVEAARDCLTRAGIAAADLGLLIVTSGTAPPGFPGPAAEVATRLGLSGTPALDLPMASAGSVFGLALAARLAEGCGEVLIVAAEKMSTVIESHPPDQNTAILFGDGAGAALVSSRPGRWEVIDSLLHTDGQFRADLAYDWNSALRMNGRSVIMQATRKLPSVIAEILERNRIAAADAGVFLLHQANQNLLSRVEKSLGVPPGRVFSNIARYGNTSSASMFIAAAEWSVETPHRAGPVVFAGFGAGFHWGAVAARPV